MTKQSILRVVFLLLTPAIFSCESINVNARPVTNHTESYQQLIDQSREELSLKTEAGKAWGLSSYDRWNLDQSIGNLIFSNPNGEKAVAPAQIIGTYNTQDQTWMWAWANHSVNPKLKTCAEKLKNYGSRHGFEELTTQQWIGSEDKAWTMAAIASHVCEAQGAYRGPAGPTLVFMTYGDAVISES